MSDGMGREPAYLSSHATNRYFIPNWGIDLYRLYVGADGELKETYTKDGVHLFPKHYDKWSNAIRPYIYQ